MHVSWLESDHMQICGLCNFVHESLHELRYFCDAQAFSDRAGSVKREVGMEDVMLAIQAKATTSFVTPPSQDVS